jgi:hypothetical protein
MAETPAVAGEASTTGTATRPPIETRAPSPSSPAPSSQTALAISAKDSGVDLTALTARVHALETELAEAKAQVPGMAGKPFEAPAGLPDRFKEKALLAAVQEAFKAINPNAEVTSIDCTEYPCITYGKGLSILELQGLKSNPAMQIYSEDSVSALKWGDLVGFIATPKDDPIARSDQVTNDAQEQRIMMRLQQMASASKTH